MDRYTDICSAYCGENPPLKWIEIAQLLMPRVNRGWRFEQQDNGEPIWAFGLGGAALLVVDVDLESRRFHLFEYLADTDRYFAEISDLASLLDDLERANRGLTRLQIEIIEDGFGSADMLNGLLRERAQQDAALDTS